VEVGIAEGAVEIRGAAGAILGGQAQETAAIEMQVGVAGDQVNGGSQPDSPRWGRHRAQRAGCDCRWGVGSEVGTA
jgi:hypothetical protein